jgi:hypothetical protein
MHGGSETGKIALLNARRLVRILDMPSHGRREVNRIQFDRDARGTGLEQAWSRVGEGLEQAFVRTVPSWGRSARARKVVEVPPA